MTTGLLNTFNNLGLATTGSAGANNISSNGSTGNVQSLTQSDFLKLLTTQLTHQDPTNPSDSNAFLNQMAQFSTVSGIQDLVKSFQGLSSSITSDQSLQATGLIGQYVSVPGKQALLTAGGNVTGDFNLSSSASSATLTITDPATGTTVRQIDLGSHAAGDVKFSWDGLDNNGVLANPGIYNVQVTALIGGNNTAVATNIDSKVSSVSMGSNGSGLQVDLQGLGPVPFSKVKKII